MKKILVVDDTESVRETIELLLEDRYTLLMASGVKQMFEQLKKTIPDVILLDIMMEDGNGMVVKTRLKGMPEYKKIPIIFLSAVEDIKTKKLAAIQSEAYITKPFTEDDLVTELKKVLK